MRLGRLVRELTSQQEELELAIMETPSGSLRNMLTDANIHLGCCISDANKALRALE